MKKKKKGSETEAYGEVSCDVRGAAARKHLRTAEIISDKI